MNQAKRLLCLLLVLITLLSAVPLFSAAAESGDDPGQSGTEETRQEEEKDEEETKATEETQAEEPEEKATAKIKIVCGSKTLTTYTVQVGKKSVRLSNPEYWEYKNKLYEFSHYLVHKKRASTAKIAPYPSDGTDKQKKEWKDEWAKDAVAVVYKVHTHKYKPGYSRLYHWNICACGDTTKEVRHVNPATDEDKICTCGYKFSDNTDLVTLWLENMTLVPKFNKETTEYIGEIVTYKDVTSTSISTRTFDGMAKVTKPQNLEIHEGANKFEILVTAEDAATTKVYTVIAVKPVKVENSWIGSDGTNVYTDVKTPVKRQVAAAEISDAVGAKMGELASADQCSRILLRPQFSKWSTKQVDLTFSPATLKALTENLQADLVVETPYVSTLTVPAADLALLAGLDAPVTVTVAKDNTFRFTSGEEAAEVTGLSDKVLLTLPVEEKK